MRRVLAIGDVFGKTGRRALSQLLPQARIEFAPDVVIANGENAAGGCGITSKVFDHLTTDLGVNYLTMGNHWHDKPEVHNVLMRTDRIVLPANMSNVPSEIQGLRIVSVEGERPFKFALMNLIGRAFMHGENRCPFTTVDRLMALIPDEVKLRIVDMHAEATSEKQAMGHYLSGRASLVYGTHSHVPTADGRILDGQTGYITDVGMTGAYDSVVGIRKEASIHRMITSLKKGWEPAEKDPWVTFLIADCDEISGKCLELRHVIWKLSEFKFPEEKKEVLST